MNNEVVETEQTVVQPLNPQRQIIDIPGVAAVKLQTLDLGRHVATAPDGKSYVVATYDDSRLNRDFVTAVYPQQNGYLTLVRLPVVEFSHEDPYDAEERHREIVQVIQQGKLREYLKSQQ